MKVKVTDSEVDKGTEIDRLVGKLSQEASRDVLDMLKGTLLGDTSREERGNRSHSHCSTPRSTWSHRIQLNAVS